MNTNTTSNNRFTPEGLKREYAQMKATGPAENPNGRAYFKTQCARYEQAILEAGQGATAQRLLSIISGTTAESEQLPSNIMRSATGGYLAKAQAGLYFCTIYYPERGLKFAVYMAHGTPGGHFWKNDAPLKSFTDREDANDFIDRLSGVAGTHLFFMDEFFTRDGQRCA